MSFLYLEFDMKEEVEMLLGLSSAKLNPSNSVMQAWRTVCLLSIWTRIALVGEPMQWETRRQNLV